MREPFCKCGHSRENHWVRGGFPFCEGTTMSSCDCKGYESEPSAGMSAKHTPGPWRVVDRRPVTGNWASRIPFAIEKVSDTHKAVIPIADVCDQPNAEDYARLIAAAPELLKALKKIAASSPCTCVGMHSANRDCIQCEANCAIARAEGGQS